MTECPLTGTTLCFVLPRVQLCRKRETLIQYIRARARWAAADVLLLLGERELAIDAIERINSKLPDRLGYISRWK